MLSVQLDSGWSFRQAADDPVARLPHARDREDPHLAGNQETEDADRLPDPIDVGDDSNPLPAEQVPQADLEVLPYGTWINAGEIRVDFVVDAHFLLLSQGILDSGHEDGLIVVP